MCLGNVLPYGLVLFLVFIPFNPHSIESNADGDQSSDLVFVS